MQVSCEAKDSHLYVKAVGEQSLIAARDVFFLWIEQARSFGLDRILCDLTLVKGLDAEQMSAQTRYELSMFLVNALPEGFRLAVLETPQQLKGSGFNHPAMDTKGAAIKVTSDVNEALEWLRVTTAHRAAAGM